jgi:dihydroxyacetone kinase
MLDTDAKPSEAGSGAVNTAALPPQNRLVNDPDAVVEDMLRGLIACRPQLIQLPGNPRVVHRRGAARPGHVGVVTGGGSGHEPAFVGYVGRGLLDAAAVGEVFSSPSAKTFFDAFKAADGGAGIACLYGNYAGDNMNVKMAIKMAERIGMSVKTVVARDDVASAPPSEMAKRRGVAGEIMMWKAGGARAAAHAKLDEVIATAQKAIDATRSVGIGLSACTIPAVGKPNFKIERGTMEVGIGHHGEPGIGVHPVMPARDVARLMLDTILPDLPFQRGDHVAVLLSGLGATPVMEQYILYADVAQLLNEAGITIEQSFVGNHFTSLDMMGVTLTITRLDEELRQCFATPCDSVGLTVNDAVNDDESDDARGD